MQALLLLAPLLTLAAAQLPPWTLLGCADETETRTLEGASIAGNMTVDRCLQFCTTADFALAGLEYGNECYCGNTLRNNAAVGKDGCTMACTGASGELCGGVSRLAVYSNPTYQPVAIIPAVTASGASGAVYTALGCYTEAPSERTLGGLMSASAAMTPQVCVDSCAAAGSVYAGVEYATECYCGAAMSNGTAAAPEVECNMKCGGNKKAFCGGPARLVVYRAAGVSAR
ncbi:WSC domain-containing protein [Geopyxis carbonaria]|nr:WSC domain-containing protein [Geopyxis carbonaria]